ncbi:uncharacterized protein RHIMIDRAFT_82817 [Rhizopus microsporus ATCC 52813]|uniref:Uncharacterized protein n=1 Tax=Rhizopus microsporus ATCC 52813 TaxID=1340429 RepID=A0A2G4SGG0_RHIZD|nr:uncharacterized protein RHIMIDRAFT_82817 [Rhizopus microsporus ATCC 52813]PHZ07849.1 hypothetical protein RHIMIDRAFT_82817 [Rhizopus microsporus ATCC 52813]
MTAYKEIMDECKKLRTLLPSSITHFDDQKAAELDKSSEHYKLLHTVQQAVFNFKFWTKESDEVMGAVEEQQKYTAADISTSHCN